MVLEFGDFLIALAEDAQPIARGFERDLGGAHIVLRGIQRRLRALHFLERNRFAFVEQRCRLSMIWARLSFERALLSAVEAVMKSFCACTMSVASTANNGWPTRDDVAGLREQLDDPAGIGREDRGRAILVDCDLAFGHVLGAEHPLLDGFDRQRRPLGALG